MKTVTRFTAFLTVLASLILFACSGGEGGTGATANSSDVSVGQITEFGSIFVNGVEFETTSSAISLEGVAGSESDLKLGMVVIVKGTINSDGLTGIADSVSVKEVIKGVVQNNNGVDTLIVMGQTIEVSAATLFSDMSIVDITGISTGDVVEVSGFVKANGVITAARIELSDGTESKLFGTVMNLDTTVKIFHVGTLIVSYLNADISGVANGTLVDGQFVEIKGKFDAVNVLDAVQIEQEQFNDNEVDEIEVEGFVTSVTPATNFSVNNMPVQVDGNTVYEGGVAVDIVEGVFIEVEGMLVNGVLIADEVEFGDAVRVEAEIANIDLVANTLTLVGIPGLVIQTNTFTEFSGDLITELSNLMQGYVVKVRGYPLSNNTTVIARQVELSSLTGGDGTEIAFQGPVTDKTDMPNSFDLLGVNISTIGIPDVNFKQDEVSIGSTGFYAAITMGSIVELVGQLDDLGVITWQEVEIEN